VSVGAAAQRHAIQPERSIRPGFVAGGRGGTQVAGTVTVQPGDTLADIARRVSGDTASWQRLYAANRAAIGPNPSRLPVGLELTLPNS